MAGGIPGRCDLNKVPTPVYSGPLDVAVDNLVHYPSVLNDLPLFQSGWKPKDAL